MSKPMTEGERMVWAAAWALGIHHGNNLHAAEQASSAVDEMRRCLSAGYLYSWYKKDDPELRLAQMLDEEPPQKPL